VKERDYLGNLYVGRQIVLKLIKRTKSDVWRRVLSGLGASDMNTRHSQYQYHIQVNS
jgi:hypothetical protein